jgi:hypothetical protein
MANYNNGRRHWDHRLRRLTHHSIQGRQNRALALSSECSALHSQGCVLDGKRIGDRSAGAEGTERSIEIGLACVPHCFLACDLLSRWRMGYAVVGVS